MKERSKCQARSMGNWAEQTEQAMKPKKRFEQVNGPVYSSKPFLEHSHNLAAS